VEKVIDMQGVTWKRNGKTIIHDINWQVKKGEHWAVLGLNGAGKTTLLNMVNGYIWPSIGSVSILSQEFGKTDIQKMRQSIGWVSSSLGERINGRHVTEEIVVSGRFAAVSLIFAEPEAADFEQARRLMEMLDVAHTYGKHYEKCSQGEKQKILIARALMANPDLLILDEPTNGLDFVAKEELLQTIEDLAARPDAPTIIFVSHHIDEVMPTFTNVLLLKDGTTFATGTRAEVLTDTNMSALYGRNITIDWKAERAWLMLG